MPGTAWRAAPWLKPEALEHAPMAGAWRQAGQVRHVFTHFELMLDVYAARVEQIVAEGFLRPVPALAAEALPSVMRKCVSVGSGGAA